MTLLEGEMRPGRTEEVLSYGFNLTEAIAF
jgi:hypothetical protein